MDNELIRVAKQFESNGYNPYVIPGGGSNVTGALGYANCAQEAVAKVVRWENHLTISSMLLVHQELKRVLVTGLKLLNSGVPLLRWEFVLHEWSRRKKFFI